MTFFPFIESVMTYFKSVRKLQDYISFDMVLPSRWVIPKKFTDGIELVESKCETTDTKIISFVAPYVKEQIEKIETSLNNIITYNKEREEKENLFKTKVEELKSLFEKENISHLRGLKFDVEDLNLTQLSNGEENT